MEAHNYVVLYFENEIDWQTAQEVFQIRSVKAWDSRPGYERIGVGRIVKGAPFLQRLQG